ncbi:hypothetical protein HD596_005463 [Nonomuraea jabiensis]|uniref:Uncharacterized protein n=1 Tax=Nonomuraea jabiensis TaxID=882448 RepID=A0A7W9LCE4_9ACTN|nr:hypothetical protein [Nonomuraea jabiensis]
MWSLLQRDRPGPHYANLMIELRKLGTSLTRMIDTA